MSTRNTSTSTSYTRSQRAHPYARPSTSSTTTSTAKPTVQRQCSFGVGNTLRRVADLKENHDRVAATGGHSQLTHTQALKLEQWNTTQTQSCLHQLATNH